MSKYNVGDQYATLSEIKYTWRIKHFIHGLLYFVVVSYKLISWISFRVTSLTLEQSYSE